MYLGFGWYRAWEREESKKKKKECEMCEDMCNSANQKSVYLQFSEVLVNILNIFTTKLRVASFFVIDSILKLKFPLQCSSDLTDVHWLRCDASSVGGVALW